MEQINRDMTELYNIARRNTQDRRALIGRILANTGEAIQRYCAYCNKQQLVD